MKLKILLLALFAAGVAASMAIASDGAKHDHGAGTACETHLSGTIASQSLVLTVDRAGDSGLAPGSQATIALGGTGQTVRVKVEGCLTGTTLTAGQVELRVRPVATTTTTTQTGTTATTTTTGTTTTGTTTSALTVAAQRRGDDGGEHHGGATTTTRRH
jgi:hypothetical protein